VKALIVADTGPLVILAKIGCLHLLAQRYQTIRIPEIVLREATVLADRHDSQRIADFVAQHIQVIGNIPQDGSGNLDFGLDEGETQAILLARQSKCPVLMDEKRGRAVAKRERVSVLGTIGLLLAAKQEGLVPEVSPLLDQMLAHDYRLATELVERAKFMAGED
jgi:predicted nucleic acid-binding protein